MSEEHVELYTIGFTNKSAQQFFTLLKNAGVRTLIDTRINNTSQLSGFAKGRDLAFFVDVILGAGYVHRVDMAPTSALLSAYRGGELDWPEYEIRYLQLLKERRIDERTSIAELDRSCLLCSEHLPDQCHRRLLADYLVQHHPQMTVHHLI